MIAALSPTVSRPVRADKPVAVKPGSAALIYTPGNAVRP